MSGPLSIGIDVGSGSARAGIFDSSVAASTSTGPVLLGAAMLGAVAGRAYPTLVDAMSAMSSLGEVYRPAGDELSQWHEERYGAFVTLQQTARTIRRAR